MTPEVVRGKSSAQNVAVKVEISSTRDFGY